MRRIILFLLVFICYTQPVYAKETESSIRIAIIDTGISTKAIDSDYIAEGKNYIVPDQDTEDKINHGTAIASLIIGKADRGLEGAYPEAILVPLVYYTIEDQSLVVGDVDMLAKSIYDAVDVYACRVINISAGLLVDSKVLKEACDYAEEKGVVVVSAVGNDNLEAPENLYFPAAYDTVIGVGAVDQDGVIAEFSQQNASVSLMASGEDLWVARASGKMTYVSGTSYAAALVSATAANILAKNPHLNPSDVRSILYENATDLDEEGYDIKSGYGVLNTQKALESAKDYHRFYDVPRDSWYFDPVMKIYELGLISGTSKTEFSPNATTTKAMVLTMLYRMADEPNAIEETKDWYTNAEIWATTYDISTSDHIEAPITREALATILWRYATYMGTQVSLYEQTDISHYSDYLIISEEAIPALKWAVGASILRGNTDKTLNPKGNATRAEVVRMLLNYLEHIEQ